MEPRWSAGALHSVKRWQLAGTDYQPAAGDCSPRSGKHLSSWTPLGHKAANQQVKKRRCFCVDLVSVLHELLRVLVGNLMNVKMFI